MDDQDKLFIEADTQVKKFCLEHKYNEYSTPDEMSKVFVEALKLYFAGSENEWFLAQLCGEFEANPSIHLCKDNSAIYQAIDLGYYLFEDNKEDLKATIDELREFLKGKVKS